MLPLEVEQQQVLLGIQVNDGQRKDKWLRYGIKVCNSCFNYFGFIYINKCKGRHKGTQITFHKPSFFLSEKLCRGGGKIKVNRNRTDIT